jgi:hypothetical protein
MPAKGIKDCHAGNIRQIKRMRREIAGKQSATNGIGASAKRSCAESLDDTVAAHRWDQGATIDWFLPSRATSPEARRLFARFERMAVSPSAFLRIVRTIRQIHVRAVLPAIQVRTPVIQRLDDRVTPPCHGRYLAANIPDAPAISNIPATTGCVSLAAGTATGSSTRSRTSSPVRPRSPHLVTILRLALGEFWSRRGCWGAGTAVRCVAAARNAVIMVRRVITEDRAAGHAP